MDSSDLHALMDAERAAQRDEAAEAKEQARQQAHRAWIHPDHTVTRDELESTPEDPKEETIWSDKTYTPWESNPVNRRNSATANKRRLRAWKRQQNN